MLSSCIYSPTVSSLKFRLSLMFKYPTVDKDTYLLHSHQNSKCGRMHYTLLTSLSCLCRVYKTPRYSFSLPVSLHSVPFAHSHSRISTHSLIPFCLWCSFLFCDNIPTVLCSILCIPSFHFHLNPHRGKPVKHREVKWENY